MAKKKPIEVTISTHKPRGYNDNQRHAVRIEGGKSDLDIPQRFTTPSSARRAARRKIAKLEGYNPQQSPVTKEWFVPYPDGSIRWIVFTAKSTTKSGKR